MNQLMLLIWISLIVVLHVRGETLNEDYSALCDRCNDTNEALPECATMENYRLNKTIYCHQGFDNPCTIGLVLSPNDGNERYEYFVCLLKQDYSTVPNMLDNFTTKNTEEDAMGVPLPSLIVTTDRSMEVVDGAGINKMEAVNDDSPDISASLQPMVESEIPQLTSETEEEKTVAKEAVESRDVPTAESVAGNDMEAITDEDVRGSPATQTDTVIDIKPAESLDYQADAPQTEITNVETPVELEDNKAEVTATAVDENSLVEPPAAAEQENANEMQSSSKDVPPENMGPEMKEDPENTNVVKDKPTGALDIRSCYSCTSTNEANCISKPTKDTNCKAVEGEQNGCYTLRRDNEIQRGCATELLPPEFQACLNEHNKSCQFCVGVNCNNETWPQCFTCNSSAADPACAWWKDSEPGRQLGALCGSYDDVCLSLIEHNGETVRGCLPKAMQQECDSRVDRTCASCNTTLCNGGIFPAQRRRCHQCADRGKCAEEQHATEALPCPLYRPNDGCYFYIDFTTGQMKRGCTSSQHDFADCQKTDDTRCIRCVNKDACNSTPLLMSPTLACSTCDSRSEKSNIRTSVSCAWAQSEDSVLPCRKKFYYFLEESCEMIYQTDVDIAVRGCTLDIGACEPGYEACQTCRGNACNVANIKWQYCLQCDSAESPNCGGEAVDIQPSMCNASVQPYESRGCYTNTNANTNVTTRGCISDLTEEGRKFCQNDTKHCSLCYENGCNNKLASTGTFLSGNFLTLLLSVALIDILQHVL